jgi:mannose-1-phosphate guanylyltransferase
MEAIILAGGFGTRLRPLTYTRAKSLLPIMNKPMIAHIIEQLPDDVDTVILAVNYRKKQIEKYFKKHDFGKTIIVNDEPEPLGTGGAVKYAEHHITDRFFVLNSDIICSLDLTEMIRFHEAHKAVSTISLWPVNNVSEFGVADVQDDGNIVGFVEKPRPEDAPSNLINAGAYLLEPQILDYIDTGHLVSMEKEIFPQIIRDTNRFYGYQFTGYWMDIGRIQSYLDIHRFLLQRQHLDHAVGTGGKIQGRVTQSCLGNHVFIGSNSRIANSIIYDNARVEGDCVLQNCIIGEDCSIGASSQLTDVVAGDRETLPPKSKKENEIIWTQPIPEGYPKKQIGNVIGR